MAGTAGAAGAGPTTAAADPGPGSGPESTDTGCFPSISSVEFEAVGDVVDVEMLLCFEGSVTIEGPGYQGVVNLSSGDKSGQVTLHLNTHLNGSDAISVTSDSLDVETNATANGSFEAEEYLLTVRDGSGTVVDQTKIIIGRPVARDLRLWRAPAGAASELQTVESIHDSKQAATRVDSRRRLEDPDTFDNLPVATNETLVVAIEAHGLEGAMAVAEGDPLARFRTALQETNATFLVEQTPESVSPSREALTPDVRNSSATHLVPQPENDTYYLVIDTSRLWGEWEGTQGGPVHIGSSPGMGFAYRFSMHAGDLHSDPPRDLQSADHRMIERFAAFPRAREEPVTLAPAAAQELVVATTVAPGTEVTVNVSGGINRTLTRTVRTQNLTGTPGFVVSLDLSGVPNGTRFTVEFGDAVTGQREPDGLRVVVREPEASLRVRDDPVTSQSLVLRSVRTSHASIVAVYTPDGVLVGTQALDSGTTDDVFVPLTYAGKDASSYRVVLHRDADRSRTLSEADERYRVGGMPVSTTVDPDTDGNRTETPTVIVEPTQPPETGTPTTEPGTLTTRPDAPTTEASTPGFGVVATIVALAGSLLLGTRER
ncbi:DUF7282 domain-containing protein [Haloparvum sp. AD34]